MKFRHSSQFLSSDIGSFGHRARLQGYGSRTLTDRESQGQATKGGLLVRLPQSITRTRYHEPIVLKKCDSRKEGCGVPRSSPMLRARKRQHRRRLYENQPWSWCENCCGYPHSHSPCTSVFFLRADAFNPAIGS